MPRVRHLAGVVALASLLTFSQANPAAASSANVAALQAALKSVGLYPVAVDGVKGPFTRRGVRALQARRHLAVDGIAGPQTRRALGRHGRPSLGSRVMHRGSRGWDVAALQFMLQRRGYSPGGVDGDFGPATRSAVISFQRSSGLGVDGLAGSATISALRHRRGPVTRTVSTPGGPVRFYHPVPGGIGDRFGAPRKGGYRHTGVDFPVGAGTPIAAAGVGTVIFAGRNTGGYGNLVVIQHRLGYTTWYAHMSRIAAYVGERVSGGTRIGYVGATGHATGPHLHFEVRIRNRPVNPVPYLLAGVAAGVERPLDCRDPDSYVRARVDDCRP
jgi:murein DD-endopeptidase MepM/ murein hydrolase activator NlpD